MDEIKLKFIGESPFLMHNNRLANPLDPYQAAISSRSGKRKKTNDDIMELARLEWEGGLYLSGGVVKIPMRIISKCIERGATKQKNGTLWRTGCVIMDDYCDFNYRGPKIKTNRNKKIPNPDLDKFYDKYNFQTIVRVGQASLLRTRPIFKEWSFIVSIAFDTSVINKETLVQCANDAGRLCGIGDWRIEKGGGFGRFRIEEIK